MKDVGKTIIDRLEANFQAAGCNMANIVAKRFPVGMEVDVRRGGKIFKGVILATPRWDDPGTIRIKSTSTPRRSKAHFVFSANWKDVIPCE